VIHIRKNNIIKGNSLEFVALRIARNEEFVRKSR